MPKGQSEADEVKESELRDSDGGLFAQDDPKVKYMGPDQGPFTCSRCEYYIVGGACKKVSGTISPDGCCNLFEKAEKP